MEELTSLLLTSQPKIVRYSPEFLQEIDPTPWAADLCRKYALNGLRLEAMRSAFAGQPDIDDKVLKFDPTDPRAVDGILGGISNGYAGHANLELIHKDSVNDKYLFQSGRDFYHDIFMSALNEIYPLGHYLKATLWFSASKHVYEAHVDLADGFLFQFVGKKHVKVWPLPDECRDAVIFDHHDLALRQSLTYQEFVLQPGEVLYIPGGAVHEVTVDEGYTSLSLSFHLGCPYPVMALCNDLNESNNDHRFILPDKYCQSDKFSISFFNPGRLMKAGQCGDGKMPSLLQKKLCEIIHADCDDMKLAGYLDNWWADKLSNPTYRGPYTE